MGISQDSQEKRDFVYGEKLFNEGMYDLAAIQFQRFVQNYSSSPKSADAQFLRAESQFALKQYESARESYLATILNYPISPQLDKAHFRIAECFEKEGKASEALESYNRVCIYYPKSKLASESLYRCAKMALEAKNPDKAESSLKVLIEKEPSGSIHSKALFLLSDVYSMKEEYGLATAILKPMVSKPILDADAAKALLVLGRIDEDQGRFEESLSQYQKAAGFLKNPDIQSLAEYNRGVLLKMMGKDPEASAAFQKALSGPLDDETRFQCLRAESDIRFRGGQFQAALEKLESIPILSDEILFEKARCFEKLKRFSDAESVHHFIQSDSLVSLSVKKRSLLSLAQIYQQQGRIEDALRIYGRFVNQYSDDSFCDAVLFQKGKLVLDSLNSLEEAYVVFQKIWEEYPDSPFAAESRFWAAEKFNQLGRFTEARRLYQTILNRNPGTTWAEKSSSRYSEIEWLNEINVSTGLAKLSHFLLRKDSSNYELGKILFQDFKQFQSAAGCLKEFLASHPTDSLRSDSTKFFLGLCYDAVSKLQNQSAYSDSARLFFESLVSSSPAGPLAASASFQLIQLSRGKPIPETLNRFLDLKRRFPALLGNDSFLFAWGKAAQERDSLLQAKTAFGEMVRRFPQSSHAEEAVFHLALLAEKTGSFPEADSLFSVYAKDYPKGRFIPQAIFHLSQSHVRSSRTDQAVALLEACIPRFRISSEFDSCRTLLGNLYLETRQFSKAALLFETLMKEDSLHSLAQMAGLQYPLGRLSKSTVFKMAQAYQGLGKIKKAKELLFRYGRSALEPDEKIKFYSALSGISEMEGNHQQAALYLEMVVQALPSDSTYNALGQFYFQSDQLAEAITAWNRALELSMRYSGKSFLNSRILIAEMRQNQYTQMESKIKDFEKMYANDPNTKEYSTELYLELAKAYTRDKEFDLALKYLKEVQKNKNSPFYPESEAETGKVLLITNKIDKALELLTEMPNRYPGHPVLSKVYLNLGDHYFRSQQFDNAISAFKKAAEDSTDREIQAVAMRYLIKIYDALHLTDAGIAMARSYIRRFPKAEDVLEKRIQIGIFCVNLKEYRMALDAFHDVQKDATDETDAEIQYWIGKCYSEMGQYDQAILEFLKVKYVSKPTRLPWAATALFEAGTSYLRLKDTSRARNMFQKIVTSEGADSDLGRIAVKRIQDIDSGNP